MPHSNTTRLETPSLAPVPSPKSTVYLHPLLHKNGVRRSHPSRVHLHVTRAPGSFQFSVQPAVPAPPLKGTLPQPHPNPAAVLESSDNALRSIITLLTLRLIHTTCGSENPSLVGCESASYWGTGELRRVACVDAWGVEDV